MLSILSKTLPNVQFTAFTNNPKIDSRRYKNYDLEIFQYIRPTFTDIWPTFKCALWILLCSFFGVNLRVLIERKLKSFEAYNEADIVLFSTRDLISLTYGLKPLFYVLFGILIATALQKPNMLYGVQVGPFGKGPKAKIGGFLVGFVLNRMKLITVRDSISREYLRKLGISKPSIYITADPAFLLQSVPNEKAKEILLREGVHKEARPLVGINISSLIYRFGFPNDMTLEDKRSEYILTMSRTVNYLIEKLGATVVFVPHTFNPKGQDDRTIAREIFSQITRKDKFVLITQERTPEELKGIIGQMDLFITTRHHPLVHSTSMHVPTIAIDYTFKMKALMKRLGQESFVCDIKTLDYDELRLKINAAYSAKERIRRELTYKIRIMQDYARKNANLLKALALNIHLAESNKHHL